MRFTRDGIVTVLLVIAALFLGSVITQRIPNPQETLNAPFEHEAGLGEPVTMRTGVVTVTGVRAAKQVTSFVDTATTRGVWLVIDTEWTPRHEPYLLSGAEARIRATDGRSFGGDSVLTTSAPRRNPGSRSCARSRSRWTPLPCRGPGRCCRRPCSARPTTSPWSTWGWTKRPRSGSPPPPRRSSCPASP